MSVLRQLKVINTIKQLAEDKFSDDVIVEQYGFGILIIPRNLEDLEEFIKERVKKERGLIFEYERPERREIEKKLVEREKD